MPVLMLICDFTTLERPLVKLILINNVGYKRKCHVNFCFPSCDVCLLGTLKWQFRKYLGRRLRLNRCQAPLKVTVLPPMFVFSLKLFQMPIIGHETVESKQNKTTLLGPLDTKFCHLEK